MTEFGWRYFHFVDPSGPRINIVDHKTDIFGLEPKPYMTMIAKEPKKEPLRFKGEPNLIWEKGTKMVMENLTLSLTMQDLVAK